MKFAWIDQHRKEFKVSWMCEALGVSSSGYYEWQDRPESNRSQENQR